ncbi:MAG: hypothetical protein J6U21_15170, partial [Bacteroidales bacterium]|nr:hypothetical protein [Bacteroidales bacterium]
VDGVTDKKDGSGTLVSGYMPRGYNCGFIYDGGSERTIAHELGHGIAGLEHVFADSKASGKTANLMDYATGTALWHFQWDQIQDPSRVWMKWNKDESEGELIQRLAIDKYFNVKLRGWENCAFLSPNGAPIIIPGVTHVLFNEDGALLNYIIDGTKYYGVISRETQTFYGYVAEKNTNLIKNYVLTVERNDILSDILYKGVKFASNGVSVVSVYKEMYSDKYLDCVNLAMWKNAQVYSTYLGRANSRGIPPQAFITHLSGNGCVDLSNPNLIGGIGTDIYINLVKKINGSKKEELLEFCNYFSEITQNKRFAFYNEELKDELQTGAFTQATIKYFINNNIYSKAIFEEHFPTKFKCRDFDIVFSSENLWEGVDKEYNKNTFFGKNREKFEYSFKDLILRRYYLNNDQTLMAAISQAERDGKAFPLNMHDDYKEYVNLFGTSSAIFAWSRFAAETSEPIIKAKIAGLILEALAASGATNYLKDKAIDFTLAFSIDFLSSYVVNILSHYLLTEDEKEDVFPIVMAKVFKDNWSEMLIDAAIAGGQALLPAMSNTKRQVINASVYGVQALELVKIYNTISGTATSDKEKTTFAEQAFNFAVGAGMSFVSEKISKKISIDKFKKKPFVAVFRQTLKNMKMTDDNIATLIYQTAKACDHPIFKDLTEVDEKIIKRLLKTDDGTKLLDLACRNNISNAQTINLLSYCKSKFDVGIRNVDLKIDSKMLGHLDYIANNLDEEGCRLVNNILNLSNPEKVLPDLAETLRLFEHEGIKKEWIRQYYNYIKQESIVIHYKGQAYKYNMPKTIGEMKTTFTDIKVSSKMDFIEFHAVDKNGNPCWCFYLQSKDLYFVPIKDEVSKCYKWIEVGEGLLSNYLRSDHFKIKVGIKKANTKNEN